MNNARWWQNSPTSWILKLPSKDGGAVLATITYERYRGVFWEAAGQSGGGWDMTRDAAQRAARRALREAGV